MAIADEVIEGESLGWASRGNACDAWANRSSAMPTRELITRTVLPTLQLALPVRDVVHPPAVDGQHLRGDPAGFRRGQKSDRVGDVLGLADAAEHGLFGKALLG